MSAEKAKVSTSAAIFIEFFCLRGVRCRSAVHRSGPRFVVSVLCVQARTGAAFVERLRLLEVLLGQSAAASAGIYLARRQTPLPRVAGTVFGRGNCRGGVARVLVQRSNVG